MLICLHYEYTPTQYTKIFKVVKNKNLHWKIFDIFFFIFAKNIDMGSSNSGAA